MKCDCHARCGFDRRLAEQVRMLRECLQSSIKMIEDFDKRICSERLDKFGPVCSHVACHLIHKMRASLAVTELKGTP